MLIGGLAARRSRLLFPLLLAAATVAWLWLDEPPAAAQPRACDFLPVGVNDADDR